MVVTSRQGALIQSKKFINLQSHVIFLIILFAIFAHSSAFGQGHQASFQLNPNLASFPYGVAFIAGPIHDSNGAEFQNVGLDTDIENPVNGYTSSVYVAGTSSTNQTNTQKVFPLNGDPTDANPSLGAAVDLVTFRDPLQGTLVLCWSWFHNPSSRASNRNYTSLGADLYCLDNAENFNSNILSSRGRISRLTFGTSTIPTRSRDRFRFAVDPSTAGGTNGYINMNSYGGPVARSMQVLPTENGLEAFFVSNWRYRLTSGREGADTGLAYDIWRAVIRRNSSGEWMLEEPTLFTSGNTGSTLFLGTAPRGFTSSVHAHNRVFNDWDIWLIDEFLHMVPATGYGIPGTIAASKSAICKDSNGEFLNIASYGYHRFNFGVGALLKNPERDFGSNEVRPIKGQNPASAFQAMGSEELSPGPDWWQDNHNSHICTSGRSQGDLGDPACGRPNELWAVQALGGGNFRGGGTNPFPNFPTIKLNIVFKNGFQPRDPCSPDWEPMIIGDPNTHAYTPVPLIGYEERYEQPRQPIQQETASSNGPSAVFTTQIGDTDLRPFEFIRGEPGYYLDTLQWRNGEPLSDGSSKRPNVVMAQGHMTILNHWQDPLDPSNLTLDRSRVMGLAVHQAESVNHLDRDRSGRPKTPEERQLLGVVPTSPDFSLKVKVPTTSLQFALVDSITGLFLVEDVGWPQNFRPGETNKQCAGGCHWHKPTPPVDPDLLDAAKPETPAVDLTANTTKFVTYDASCRPIFRDAGTTTRPVPKLTDHGPLLDGLERNCGSCHGDQATTPASRIFVYQDDAKTTHERIIGYYNSNEVNLARTEYGAINTPLWQNAIGWKFHRVEQQGGQSVLILANGRPNATQSHGYNHAHDGVLEYICDGAHPQDAKWAHDLGLWLDHDMPVDYDNGELRNSYPPEVHAIVQAGALRVGTWDDTGIIERLTVLVNGQQQYEAAPSGGIPNGTVNIPLTFANSEQDRIEIIATDFGRGPGTSGQNQGRDSGSLAQFRKRGSYATEPAASYRLIASSLSPLPGEQLSFDLEIDAPDPNIFDGSLAVLVLGTIDGGHTTFNFPRGRQITFPTSPSDPVFITSLMNNVKPISGRRVRFDFTLPQVSHAGQYFAQFFVVNAQTNSLHGWSNRETIELR